MKQTEAEKKIISLWPEWPNAVGENLSDDALRFIGWLKLRHPEVLSFRSAQTKLELIVDWLSAERAISESYRRADLVHEHIPVPAQPNAVNGFPKVVPLRNNSAEGSTVQKSTKASQPKKAKTSASLAKAKTTSSSRKARSNRAAGKPKAKAPAKNSKAKTSSRSKSKKSAAAAKSAKTSSRSKSKKSASAAKPAKRKPRK